jgi:hypothetical protein
MLNSKEILFMNKAFKLLFALLISFQGFSQSVDSAKWNRFNNLYNNPFKTFKAVNVLDASGSANLSTQKISNQFIKPFIKGGKLESEVIDKGLEKDGDRHFSLQAEATLQYINLAKGFKKNQNLHWYLKTGMYNRTSALVSHDGMRLAFKGNTDSGRYNLDNSQFDNLRFHTIGGGLYFHADKKARPFNLQVGLFVMQTPTYDQIRVNENNYLQGTEDSFLLGLNYSAEFSNNKAFTTGYGLAGEIAFNQKLNSKSIWGFSMRNFGISAINNNVTSYSAKGEFNFDGVFIPEVNRLSEDGYFEHQLDSFTQQLSNKKEGQSKTLLVAPAVTLYYCLRLNSGYYQISLNHSGAPSLPVVELRYSNFIGKNMILGASVGTGGYTYLNADFNWAISKHWFIQAGIYHLEALVLPAKLGGMGGGGGLQYAF